jgi:hypothetical protein
MKTVVVYAKARARSLLSVTTIAAVLLGLWHAPGAPEAAAQSASGTPFVLPECEQVSLDGLVDAVVELFDDTFDTRGNGGGRPNEILLKNCTDAALKVRGSVHINRIGGPRVEPVNVAVAYGQCTDC